MSVLVSGLCYQITFRCPKRKAISVALGDHAHDDGSHVWPSIKRLAAKVEWSERTVQRVLRELEALGVLIVVKEGGSGPKDTREWAFDMKLLRDLADGNMEISDVIHMGDSETPLEGDSETPLPTIRVSAVQGRVSGSTPKGDSAVTRTISNRKEPSGAQARERFSDLDIRNAAARPVFVIGAGDLQWSAWMEHLKRLNRDDLVEAARDVGKLSSNSRWPTGDDVPTIPGMRKRSSVDVAKRIVGEGGR